MNLPNKITLTRIFMIPVFVLIFFLDILRKKRILLKKLLKIRRIRRILHYRMCLTKRNIIIRVKSSLGF